MYYFIIRQLYLFGLKYANNPLQNSKNPIDKCDNYTAPGAQKLNLFWIISFKVKPINQMEVFEM